MLGADESEGGSALNGLNEGRDVGHTRSPIAALVASLMMRKQVLGTFETLVVMWSPHMKRRRQKQRNSL